MCGILGMLSLAGPVDEYGLWRGMQALAHRGPDGRGHWVSVDRRVALGYQRLGIIDLAGGDSRIGARISCTF